MKKCYYRTLKIGGRKRRVKLTVLKGKQKISYYGKGKKRKSY